MEVGNRIRRINPCVQLGEIGICDIENPSSQPNTGANPVGPFFPDGERKIEVLLLNSEIQARLSRVPGTTSPVARPVLTKAAHNTIRQVRRVQQYEELIRVTQKHVAGQTDLTDKDVRSSLRLKRDGFFAAGFWQRDT